MVQKSLKYPISTQDFETLITEGYVYVDKTEHIYRLANGDSSYIFLSRPRRFGKSLLVSTLKAYFEGRKDLFKGLAIEKMETEWTQHPVVHMSMASAKGLKPDALERTLHNLLEKNEQRLGVKQDGVDLNTRFMNLVMNVNKNTGKKVVVLIDEYDAPLLDTVAKGEEQEKVRDMMRSLYSPLKDLNPYLRFTFLTGITKFSQLSIFSELNNLSKISMQEEYAGICGITEEEMASQLGTGIEALAQEKGIGIKEAIAALKENYDGYHFTWPSADVYNPFSLLHALADKSLGNYWFDSGTPTVLVETMRRFGMEPLELCNAYEVDSCDFDAPVEGMTTIIPLLYQCGYLTIKGYDADVNLYSLDLPNKEVRISLLKSLVPNYWGKNAYKVNTIAARMQRTLLDDDLNAFFELFKAFLNAVPGADYVDKPEHYEAHWHRMLTIILALLGATVDVEVKTKIGRIDLVARTQNKLYLMEFKVNKKNCAAMEQIDLKEYDKRFALCNLPVVRVAANFGENEKNITGWKIN